MEYLENGYYYHIYNRGNNREKLFKEHSDYVLFMNLFIKYIHEVADVFCYCLIPNHFHFLIRTKEHKDIVSEKLRRKPLHLAFSNFFNAYSKNFNFKYDRTGSLFQERYRRKKVDSEIYLKYLIHYIHTNPVHHDVCDDFRSYKYSSYNSILGRNPTILMRATVVELFGDTDNYIYTHMQRARLAFIENLIKGD